MISKARVCNQMTRRQMLALSSSLMFASCRRSGPARPPNIVVLLSDALRADHLSCYGHTVPTSPNIDQFAKRSLLFERCYSQASWTKPSIASLFSGLMPSVHQAVVTTWDAKNLAKSRVQTLREAFVSPAETLHGLGYQTAMFLANPWVQQFCGFARGFDHYRYVASEQPEKQTDAVLEWIENDAVEPFFLYIHVIDPHGPYRPPEECFRALFGMSPNKVLQDAPKPDVDLIDEFDGFYKYLGKPSAPERPPLEKLSPAGVLYLKDLYDGEIANVDRQFARLVDALERKGLTDRTAVAVTSDHGEAFGEHGLFSHGDSLFGEETHVPLIIHAPGVARGKRVPWSVSQFDLHPTLVALAGGSPDRSLQAQALLSPGGKLLVKSHRPVFAELDYHQADTKLWESSMVLGTTKVLSTNNGADFSVFDLERDPREQTNLRLPPNGTAYDRLVARLRDEREENARRARQFGDPVWTEPGEDDYEKLHALGYT